MLAVLFALVAAPDYLTSVRSEPIEAAGTAAEIAARAETCIAQQLGSGAVGGDLIVSRDVAGGVIVARNAVDYMDGMMNWRLRSRLTLEARDGRFRIEHTSIERFNDQAGGWAPVGKWWGSGWGKAEQALKDVSQGVAACVQGQGRSADVW